MKRILVVDDEDLICFGIEKVFKKDGIEVKIAKNIKDATNELESGNFDLCFLDVKLPDGNGLSLIDRVKEIKPDTKIIVMSGNLLTDDISEKAAHHIFIPKPFDLNQIRSITEQLLYEGKASL